MGARAFFASVDWSMAMDFRSGVRPLFATGEMQYSCVLYFSGCLAPTTSTLIVVDDRIPQDLCVVGKQFRLQRESIGVLGTGVVTEEPFILGLSDDPQSIIDATQSGEPKQ